jgi:hypothetical protein
MRKLALATAALPLLVAAGCGDDGRGAAHPRGQVASPAACPSTPAGAADVTSADLDGAGTADRIRYVPATGRCGPLLVATVGGRALSVALDDDLPVRAASSFSISVAGRDGDIAVVRQEHPRGGFQAHLYGYADGRPEELEVDDTPIFPFVATDTLSTPLTATCLDRGFEITQARAHQPVGAAPTWDIEQTTYTVDGNTVTKGATTEVADDVPDGQLSATYADLVQHRLFANCRARS